MTDLRPKICHLFVMCTNDRQMTDLMFKVYHMSVICTKTLPGTEEGVEQQIFELQDWASMLAHAWGMQDWSIMGWSMLQMNPFQHA